MVNNGNNLRQITTVKGIGSNPVMPAVKIQGVAVFAATLNIIWAAFIGLRLNTLQLVGVKRKSRPAGSFIFHC